MVPERLLQMREMQRQLNLRTATELLRLACERFSPRLTMATGFGPEGALLIDLAARSGLRFDIFTLDTGLFFPETYELWRTLERRYDVVIRAVRPQLTVDEQAERHGSALWARDPDLCCRLRKVLPLERALEGFDAWITGVRREQTALRSKASSMELDERFGLVKVNPLVEWTGEDVWRYVRDHHVPFNPLHERGYPSIGCFPCTTPVRPGEDPRGGRWRGREKTECGIHRENAPLTLPVIQGGER